MAAVRRKPRKSWRDVVDIHPAADVFPLMSEAELVELAKNIRTAGLQQPVLVWEQLTNDGPEKLLLDGRNRLDAMELAGIPVVNEAGDFLQQHHYTELSSMSSMTAAAVVTGLNLYRRHLTPGQRAKLLADAVVADKEFLAELRKIVTLHRQDDEPARPNGRPGRGGRQRGRPAANRGPVADIVEVAGVGHRTARRALAQAKAEAEAAAADETQPAPPKPPAKKPARKPAPKKPPTHSVEAASLLVTLKRLRPADITDQDVETYTALQHEMRRLITGRK